MLEEINKKREKICRISQIFTFILVIVAIVLVLLTAEVFLLGLLGGLLLVVLLYVVSKKIIIPRYNIVKGELINLAIKKDREDITTEYIDSFKSQLDVFFDVVNMSYTNAIRIKYKGLDIDVEDFVVTERKVRKASVTYKGKIIQFSQENFFSKEILAIPDFLNDSKEFQNTAKEHFKNANLVLSLTGKGKYLTNTSIKEDLYKISSLFDKVDNFHLILYKNNKVSIMIKEKVEPFECPLQKEIDVHTLENCKKAYAEVNKILKFIENN